jgi:hypothetical protein
MLRPEPPDWARVLPGYGVTKVIFDTGLTPQFTQIGPLLIGLAWVGGLLLVGTLVLIRARPSMRASA